MDSRNLEGFGQQAVAKRACRIIEYVIIDTPCSRAVNVDHEICMK